MIALVIYLVIGMLINCIPYFAKAGLIERSFYVRALEIPVGEFSLFESVVFWPVVIAAAYKEYTLRLWSITPKEIKEMMEYAISYGKKNLGIVKDGYLESFYERNKNLDPELFFDLAMDDPKVVKKLIEVNREIYD